MEEVWSRTIVVANDRLSVPWVMAVSSEGLVVVFVREDSRHLLWTPGPDIPALYGLVAVAA